MLIGKMQGFKGCLARKAPDRGKGKAGGFPQFPGKRCLFRLQRSESRRLEQIAIETGIQPNAGARSRYTGAPQRDLAFPTLRPFHVAASVAEGSTPVPHRAIPRPGRLHDSPAIIRNPCSGRSTICTTLTPYNTKYNLSFPLTCNFVSNCHQRSQCHGQSDGPDLECLFTDVPPQP